MIQAQRGFCPSNVQDPAKMHTLDRKAVKEVVCAVSVKLDMLTGAQPTNIPTSHHHNHRCISTAYVAISLPSCNNVSARCGYP